MTTPLATLTFLGDATGDTPLFQRPSGQPAGLFAELFKTQMAHGINGALQELALATHPLGAASLSVIDARALAAANTQVYMPTNLQQLSISVIHASETPEYPAYKDSEASPVVQLQPASPEIVSGTPDVSEVEDESLSQIDDAQVVGAGTTGNLQAEEEETMNTPAVQNTTATSAQNTVRQNQHDAFSAESSFDRVLDQRVANRKQDQKNLEKQSSVQKQERADKTPENSDAQTVEKEAKTRAAALARTKSQLLVDPDLAAHNLAINQAMAIAEAMRPTQLPANELPVKTAALAVGEQAFNAVLAGQTPDALAAEAARLASGKAVDISAPVTATTALQQNDTAAGEPNGAIDLSAFAPAAETAAGTSTMTRPQTSINPGREATAAAKPGMAAISLKDPALTSTAAMFAAHQSKTDAETGGGSQGSNQFTQAEVRGPGADVVAKDSFTNAFGTVFATSGPTVVNGVPQALSGLQQGSAAGGRLQPHVGHPGWNQALGQHMMVMAGNAQYTATLTLNPPDLGPLQIVLQVQNSQAEATFITAQPEVKQALEAALPRLREMMEQAGIELGQATVNTGSPQEQTAQQQFGRDQRPHVNAFAADTEDTATQLAVLPAASGGRGMVDVFA